jgi:hypothetical protein
VHTCIQTKPPEVSLRFSSVPEASYLLFRCISLYPDDEASIATKFSDENIRILSLTEVNKTYTKVFVFVLECCTVTLKICVFVHDIFSTRSTDRYFPINPLIHEAELNKIRLMCSEKLSLILRRI